MRRWRFVCLLAWSTLCAAWIAVPASFAEGSGAPRLEYLESTSRGADPRQPLPMLVILHGLGDSPENLLPLFQDVEPAARLIAARAPDPWPPGSSWYPIDAPLERKNAAILARSELVLGLMRQLSRERPTRGKPVVTGFSQGGVLSFTLAAFHADALGGAVPIAGHLPPGMPKPKRAPAGFSLLAFHGEADARIPYADAQRSQAALAAVGTRASLSGFPGVGHGISPAMRTQIHAALHELLDAQAGQ